MASMEALAYKPLCSIIYKGSLFYDYTQFLSSKLEWNVVLKNNSPGQNLPYIIEAEGCHVITNNIPDDMSPGIKNYLKSFSKLAERIGETDAYWRQHDKLFRIIGEMDEDKLILSVMTDTPFFSRLLWKFGALRIMLHGSITLGLDKKRNAILPDPEFKRTFNCYEVGPTPTWIATVPINSVIKSIDPASRSVTLVINANMNLDYGLVEVQEACFRTPVKSDNKLLLKPYDCEIELDSGESIPCHKQFLAESSAFLSDKMSKAENQSLIKVQGLQKPGADILHRYVSGCDIKIDEVLIEPAVELMTFAVENGMQPLAEVMQDILIIFYGNELSMDKCIEIFKRSKNAPCLKRINYFVLADLQQAPIEVIMASANYQKLSMHERNLIRSDI